MSGLATPGALALGLLLAGAVSGTAAAQVAPATRLAWSAQPTNVSLVEHLAAQIAHDSGSAIVGSAPPPRAPQADRRPSATRRALRAAVGIGSGVVVGGWLGYFTSQVGRSDWDQLAATEKSELRRGYTIAGGGVGAVLGYFMRPRARRPLDLPQPAGLRPRSGRLLFPGDELRRSIGVNMLEVVELGRPEWIKRARDDRARQAAPSTAAVEASSVVIYVGDEKVGALETLRDISIPEVAELRFYDAGESSRRWGGEHRYGAIEVVPVATTPAPANSAQSTTTPAVTTPAQ